MRFQIRIRHTWIWVWPYLRLFMESSSWDRWNFFKRSMTLNADFGFNVEGNRCFNVNWLFGPNLACFGKNEPYLKLRIRTIRFFTVFKFFERDFEALAIEKSEIRFQNWIPRFQIMLNQYFQLIPWKIANFKFNWQVFLIIQYIKRKKFLKCSFRFGNDTSLFALPS